jgi:hypothetical protein
MDGRCSEKQWWCSERVYYSTSVLNKVTTDVLVPSQLPNTVSHVVSSMSVATQSSRVGRDGRRGC